METKKEIDAVKKAMNTLAGIDENKVLSYPEKPQPKGMTSPLGLAIDGEWKPEIIGIDEILLAQEIVTTIEKYIEGRDPDIINRDIHETEYIDDRFPFEFSTWVRFDTNQFRSFGCEPTRRLNIWEIEIHCYWNNRDIKFRYSKEVLINAIEEEIKTRQ